MKNILTIVLVATCINSTTAQEFKIKKGSIIIDNQAVADIKKEKDQYLISDLSGTLLYRASIKNTTPKGRETSQKWIELVNKENKVHEVALKLKSINVNMEKRLVENLVDKEFLTLSGVDDYKYNKENTSITDELDQILDEFEAAYALEDQKAEENKLKLGKAVDGYYEITSDFMLVGYINGKSRPDPKDKEKALSEYVVYDTAKQPVALLQFGSYDTGNELKPKYIKTFADNKEHAIITKCKFYLINSEPMAIRMVKLLFAHDYIKSNPLQ